MKCLPEHSNLTLVITDSDECIHCPTGNETHKINRDICDNNSSKSNSSCRSEEFQGCCVLAWCWIVKFLFGTRVLNLLNGSKRTDCRKENKGKKFRPGNFSNSFLFDEIKIKIKSIESQLDDLPGGVHKECSRCGDVSTSDRIDIVKNKLHRMLAALQSDVTNEKNKYTSEGRYQELKIKSIVDKLDCIQNKLGILGLQVKSIQKDELNSSHKCPCQATFPLNKNNCNIGQKQIPNDKYESPEIRSEKTNSNLNIVTNKLNLKLNSDNNRNEKTVDFNNLKAEKASSSSSSSDDSNKVQKLYIKKVRFESSSSSSCSCRKTLTKINSETLFLINKNRLLNKGNGYLTKSENGLHKGHKNVCDCCLMKLFNEFIKNQMEKFNCSSKENDEWHCTRCWSPERRQKFRKDFNDISFSNSEGKPFKNVEETNESTTTESLAKMGLKRRYLKRSELQEFDYFPQNKRIKCDCEQFENVDNMRDALCTRGLNVNKKLAMKCNHDGCNYSKICPCNKTLEDDNISSDLDNGYKSSKLNKLEYNDITTTTTELDNEDKTPKLIKKGNFIKSNSNISSTNSTKESDNYDSCKATINDSSKNRLTSHEDLISKIAKFGESLKNHDLNLSLTRASLNDVGSREQRDQCLCDSCLRVINQSAGVTKSFSDNYINIQPTLKNHCDCCLKNIKPMPIKIEQSIQQSNKNKCSYSIEKNKIPFPQGHYSKKIFLPQTSEKNSHNSSMKLCPSCLERKSLDVGMIEDSYQNHICPQPKTDHQHEMILEPNCLERKSLGVGTIEDKDDSYQNHICPQPKIDHQHEMILDPNCFERKSLDVESIEDKDDSYQNHMCPQPKIDHQHEMKLCSSCLERKNSDSGMIKGKEDSWQNHEHGQHKIEHHHGIKLNPSGLQRKSLDVGMTEDKGGSYKKYGHPQPEIDHQHDIKLSPSYFERISSKAEMLEDNHRHVHPKIEHHHHHHKMKLCPSCLDRKSSDAGTIEDRVDSYQNHTCPQSKIDHQHENLFDEENKENNNCTYNKEQKITHDCSNFKKKPTKHKRSKATSYDSFLLDPTLHCAEGIPYRKKVCRKVCSDSDVRKAIENTLNHCGKRNNYTNAVNEVLRRLGTGDVCIEVKCNNQSTSMTGLTEHCKNIDLSNLPSPKTWFKYVNSENPKTTSWFPLRDRCIQTCTSNQNIYNKKCQNCDSTEDLYDQCHKFNTWGNEREHFVNYNSEDSFSTKKYNSCSSTLLSENSNDIKYFQNSKYNLNNDIYVPLHEVYKTTNYIDNSNESQIVEENNWSNESSI